jgi:hypothetical protein
MPKAVLITPKSLMKLASDVGFIKLFWHNLHP